MFNDMYQFDETAFPKSVATGNYRSYNVYRSLLHGHGYTTKFLQRRILYICNNVCGDFFKEYFEDFTPVSLEKELHTYISIPDHSY